MTLSVPILKPYHYILIGVVLTTAFFLLLYSQGCGRSTFDIAEADSLAKYRDTVAFYKGREATLQADKDSLVKQLAEIEPQVTYLTKNYYAPVPDKFAVSDSDAAALYILNFAEENK